MLPQLPGVYMGGDKQTDASDIAFGAQLFVEKSLETRSAGGIAEFDIARYFDNLLPFQPGRPRKVVLFVFDSSE